MYVMYHICIYTYFIYRTDSVPTGWATVCLEVLSRQSASYLSENNDVKHVACQRPENRGEDIVCRLIITPTSSAQHDQSESPSRRSFRVFSTTPLLMPCGYYYY